MRLTPDLALALFGGMGKKPQNAEDRIATEWHPEAGGHPCAGFATRFTAEDTDRLGQSPGALRVAGGQLGQAFHKGLACTRRGETAKTSDLHGEAHGVLRHGEVPQAARIAAMHPG
jgi:hypothetical protein